MARPQQISTETITAALAARPEVTAAELAGVLGIGQSTTAKRLAALEVTGPIRRTPGGRVAGVRVADRWSLASAAPDPTASDPTAPDDAGPEPALRETAQPETAVTKGSGGRLARGELRSLVREYLASRPGDGVGPSAIGKALGRSQGAVSNSLVTMAARGEVELVRDRPRRYRIAT